MRAPLTAETARIFARMEGCTCDKPRVTFEETDRDNLHVAVIHHRDGCPLDPGATGPDTWGGLYGPFRKVDS